MGMLAYASFCALLFAIDSAYSSNEWDLLIFTQNWPPTVCENYLGMTGYDRQCAKLKNPDTWTIHGVWPTKLHTIGPGFCNTSLVFDPSKISFLRDEMETSWPGIEADKGTESLWSHEWTKHGTCAVQLPALDSEEKYFRQGLEWLHMYEMTEILAKNGITPSETIDYPPEAIQMAIIDSLGVNPRIECVFERHTKRPALLEIRICFDKSLNITDCDGTMVAGERKPLQTNCPVGKNIRYRSRMPGRSIPQQRSTRSTAIMWRRVIDVLIFLDWLV